MTEAELRQSVPASRRVGWASVAWPGIVGLFAVLPTHALFGGTVGGREDQATQVGHFVEFALLAALLDLWLTAQSPRRPRRRRLAVASAAWLAAVAYGAAIEVVQLPLPYRDAQVSDLAIDAAGALAGLLALSAGRSLRRRGGRRRAR